MNELVSILLSQVLPAVVTAAVTWFFARKKNNAEASGSELENVEKALVIYRGIITDLHDKIKLLEAELDRVQKLLEEAKQTKK